MTWQPLFGITVQHSFFSATTGPLLDFIPSLETQKIIRSAGLITRADSNRIILCYDDEQEEILRYCIPKNRGKLEFLFNIYAQDPYYAMYTDRASHSEAVPFFSSLGKSIPHENGLRLEASNDTTKKDRTGETVMDKKEKQGHLVKQPIFNVSISIEEQSSLKHQEYFISCAARKTYWKYYLLGELAEQEIEIIDLKEEVQFRNAGQQTPFPGRTATIFYSAEPILLEERPNRRFQLRKQGSSESNGSKVLIKRLPNASVENLSKDIIKGKEVDVSEIYINY